MFKLFLENFKDKPFYEATESLLIAIMVAENLNFKRFKICAVALALNIPAAVFMTFNSPLIAELGTNHPWHNAFEFLSALTCLASVIYLLLAYFAIVVVIVFKMYRKNFWEKVLLAKY